MINLVLYVLFYWYLCSVCGDGALCTSKLHRSLQKMIRMQSCASTSWCNSTQAGLLLSWWLWRKSLRHLCQGHQGEMMIDRSWKWLRNNFFLPQSPSRVGMKFRRKWINFWVQCSINMVLVGRIAFYVSKQLEKGKIWILSYTFCIQSESSKVNLALFEFWRRPRVIPGVKLHRWGRWSQIWPLLGLNSWC